MPFHPTFVILSPDGAVRKVRVTPRLLLSLASLLTSLFCLYLAFILAILALSGVTWAKLTNAYEAEPRTNILPRLMHEDIAQLAAEHQRLLAENDAAMKKLATTRQEYAYLSELKRNQEQVFERYRAILEHERPFRRVGDMVFGFASGVVSSLVASWLWARFLAKAATDDTSPN